MAEYDYVEWSPSGITPVTGQRLFQMSENDQHLKDLVDAGPKGIIGWAQRSSDRELGNPTVGDWYNADDLIVTCDIEENRLIRATYRCHSVFGGSKKGVRTLGARIIMNGTTVWGVCQGQVEQNYTRGFDPIIFIRNVSAGTHTFRVQHRIAAGDITNVSWQATAQSPHQLIIEDIGTYVDPA